MVLNTLGDPEGKAMVIPLNNEINCSDGPGGRITCLIVNPLSLQLTHLVVAEQVYPYLKRLVPVQILKEQPSGCILLSCTQRQLATLRPFLEVEYTPDDTPYFAYETHNGKMWPYDTDETLPVPIQLETVSSKAVTLHRGARVKATNGWVGQVAGFSIQPMNGTITDLVLHRGRFWRRQERAVPVSEIERMEKEVVYLKLDKYDLKILLAVSMGR